MTTLVPHGEGSLIGGEMQLANLHPLTAQPPCRLFSLLLKKFTPSHNTYIHVTLRLVLPMSAVLEQYTEKRCETPISPQSEREFREFRRRYPLSQKRGFGPFFRGLPKRLGKPGSHSLPSSDFAGQKSCKGPVVPPYDFSHI
jgi:hypothetical protein